MLPADFFLNQLLGKTLLRCLRFFSNSTFTKNSSGTLSLLNSMDPDQARHFVEPNLDPNYLQRLSADDSSRQRVTLHGYMGFNARKPVLGVCERLISVFVIH